MNIRLILAAITVGLLLPLCAVAEGEPEGCPSGQKLATFGDGNSVSPVCVDDGAGMEDTVPSTEYVEGVEDPNNYD